VRESQATAEAAPAAPAVEPRALVEQIVQAARVVVNGDEAEMHVRLDPPALGTVHVTAESRGTALDLTISADRPETQALLARALPDIQQTLADRGLGSASVSIATFPTAADGRRMPDRRPPEPRERPTSQPSDRRRTPSASRRVSAVDITV
jgi:flagellar hook-length control protein FliK